MIADIDDINTSVRSAMKLLQKFGLAKGVEEKNILQINSKLNTLRLNLEMASSLAEFANRQIEVSAMSNMVLILSFLKSLILWLTNEEENKATMRKIMTSAAIMKLPSTTLEGFELIYETALRGLEDSLKDLKEKVGAVKDDGGGMIHHPKVGKTIYFPYSNCFRTTLFGDRRKSKIISSHEDWKLFFLNHSLWIAPSLKEEEEEDENVTLGELKKFGSIDAATKAKKSTVMKKPGMKKKKKERQVLRGVKNSFLVQPVGSQFALALQKNGKRVQVTNPYFKG